METLTIGELARAAGVNVETVRYYERRGYLVAPVRAVAKFESVLVDQQAVTLTPHETRPE